MDLHNQEVEIELWYESDAPALIVVRVGSKDSVYHTEYFGKVTSHNLGEIYSEQFSLLNTTLKRVVS